MREEIYTVYAEGNDMTFIMKNIYNGDELVTTEVVGWYWGEYGEDATKACIGKLKAEY